MASPCGKYSTVTVVVATLGVLIITQTQTVESVLQCYQCNSTDNPECVNLSGNDPTTLLKPCPQGSDGREPFCRKIYQIIHVRGEMKVVVRKCGLIKYNKGDCYYVNTYDHAETVCQCFTDGCNSSPRLSDSVVVLLLTVGLAEICFNYF